MDADRSITPTTVAPSTTLDTTSIPTTTAIDDVHALLDLIHSAIMLSVLGHGLPPYPTTTSQYRTTTTTIPDDELLSAIKQLRSLIQKDCDEREAGLVSFQAISTWRSGSGDACGSPVDGPCGVSLLVHIVRGDYNVKDDVVLVAMCILSGLVSVGPLSHIHPCCVRRMVEVGVIPLFIKRMLDEDVQIAEQADFALGRLAYSVEFRDEIHRLGGLTTALDVVRNPVLFVGQRRQVITRAISDMCRGNPEPRPEYVAELVIYFEDMLKKLILARESGEHDDEVEATEMEAVHVLWGITFLTNGGRCQIGLGLLPLIVSALSVPQGIAEPGFGDAPVVERLVPSEQMAYVMEYLPRSDLERLCLLNSDIWNCCVCANRRLYNRARSVVCYRQDIRIPAAHIIGNIIAISNEQTEEAISLGALRVIESIVASLHSVSDDGGGGCGSDTTTAADEAVTVMDSAATAATSTTTVPSSALSEWREICWLLSNVVVSSAEIASLVFSSTVFYHFILDALQLENAPRVNQEAAWVVANTLTTIRNSDWEHFHKNQVPLGWITAALACCAGSHEAIPIMDDILTDVFLLTQVNCSLSAIKESIQTDGVTTSNPQQIFEFARALKHEDRVANAIEKLIDMFGHHILPALVLSGKLDHHDDDFFSYN